MLYQGSTHNERHDILTDWLTTDIAIAAHEWNGLPVHDGNSYEYRHNSLMWFSTKNKPIIQFYDPSLIFPEHQSSVIKSWRVVENIQKELLESSKEIFEGDGF